MGVSYERGTPVGLSILRGGGGGGTRGGSLNLPLRVGHLWRDTWTAQVPSHLPWSRRGHLLFSHPQSIWSRQFGEARLFPAPKLTKLYHTPSMSTRNRRAGLPGPASHTHTHTHTHTLTVSLSLYHTLSHTHIRTHTHTHPLSHTYTHSLSPGMPTRNGCV